MPGIGMPTMLYLQDFCRIASAAFNATAYHVGSSLPGHERQSQFRDVDVRVLLDDAVYEKMELGDPALPQTNARWSAFAMAFSALGKQMTGLSIDFQLQPIGYANEKFGKDHPRNPCGIWSEQRTRREDSPDALRLEWCIEHGLCVSANPDGRHALDYQPINRGEIDDLMERERNKSTQLSDLPHNSKTQP